ncbi:Multidrug export protein MepA [Clostridiales bacterium CHKCI001]|nr:Multidrug export protein MepA [Clostridiales bacterium CHKCI001]
MKELRKRSIMWIIVSYSVPAAMTLFITAFYNIVDRIFIGNCNGSVALAALSICYPLSFLVAAVGLFCNGGGRSIFESYLKKGQEWKANHTFGMSFLMTAASEIFLTIFLFVFMEEWLRLFSVTESTYTDAKSYFEIMALGCVPQGLTLVLCDFIRIGGKLKEEILIMALGAIANIILDWVFVVVLQQGVKGAAIASVTAQIISALAAGCYIMSKKSPIKIAKKFFIIDDRLCTRIVKGGLIAGFIQLLLGVVVVVYNRELNLWGQTIAVSVYSVTASLLMFFMMLAAGIGQGIRPILSEYYENGQRKLFLHTMSAAMCFSLLMTGMLWILVELFPEQILSIFGADAVMMTIGVSAIRQNFIIAPVVSIILLGVSYFQAVKKEKIAMLLSFLWQIAVLIPFIYLLPLRKGLMGIFLARPICEGIMAIIVIFWIQRSYSKIKKMTK